MLMQGACQSEFVHSLPQTDCAHVRINVTMRLVLKQGTSVLTRVPKWTSSLRPPVIIGHSKNWMVGECFDDKDSLFNAGKLCHC